MFRGSSFRYDRRRTSQGVDTLRGGKLPRRAHALRLQLRLRPSALPRVAFSSLGILSLALPLYRGSLDAKSVHRGSFRWGPAGSGTAYTWAMSGEGMTAGGLPPHPELARYYRPGEKKRFVREIFDATAEDYERVERLMSLGWGAWYRRRALRRHGLPQGNRGLDVAMGTGLVAREILRLAGNGLLLVGLDPSLGMLHQARRRRALPAVAAFGEATPFPPGTFDFLTMGYALRHLPDLLLTFREFHRILRPGGKVLILEITPPRRGSGKGLLKWYIRFLTPAAALLFTGHKATARLWRYFWDTMEACVPPEEVLQALEKAGFARVSRFVELGIFSEYTGIKP